MKIGLDIDGVLLDFDKQFWIFHNEKYGTNFNSKTNPNKNYHFSKSVGITREEEHKRIGEFFKHPYFDLIEPVEFSQEAVEELSKKHSLYVITSRHNSLRRKTIPVLQKYFPRGFNHVFFTNNYRGLNAEKADICLDLNIELMIDDHINNVLRCSKKGVNSFLYDGSWNQGDLPENVSRVYSWKEIVERLKI